MAMTAAAAALVGETTTAAAAAAAAALIAAKRDYEGQQLQNLQKFLEKHSHPADEI